MISDLRIIERLELEPCPGINFVVGPNGAGKTSVLEAIYLAGRGRTFRHPDAGPLIRRGAPDATVLVQIERGSSTAGRSSLLGVRREKGTFSCRYDGQDIKKRSTLASILPVQWIGSQPQLFLSAGPDIRRRFLDMGLFHVEHGYLGALAEFQQTLRQRNAAIRQGDLQSVQIWNQPLAMAATIVEKYRAKAVIDLMRHTQGILGKWRVDFIVTYRYRRGWPNDAELGQLLAARSQKDLQQGYTSIGPQRAELELLADGVLAEKNLSRGQQKILVMAMHLALYDLIIEQGAAGDRRAPVVLLDDLAAELDPGNREKVIGALEERGAQAFLTKIEQRSLSGQSGDTKTFHVEQGAIR